MKLKHDRNCIKMVYTALLSLGVLCAASGPVKAQDMNTKGQAMQPNRERKPGEKVDITVYTNAEDYASFPQLARTDKELVLLFQVQNLAKLRAVTEHPHFQKVAVPRWATSRNGGLTWEIHDTCLPLGRVQTISYLSAPLADGGTVTLTFNGVKPLYAIIQHGRIGYRPYQDEKAEIGEINTITNLGPFSHFCPHGMTRTADGKIIAGGYGPFKAPDGKRDKTTVDFLASTDEGQTWTYLSHIPNETMFDFCEPAILPTKDGRLIVVMRVEGDKKIMTKAYPMEGRAEKGYFLYQAESSDGGRTWTVPVQLPLWGHPPSLLRLASGNILMVYGHRRAPYEIHAVLSRDEGRTWDLTTLCTIHRFAPGNYDLGYPVAAQCPDGSIVCAYYGYSTEKIGEKMPHGIFASVFDEAWMSSSSPADRLNLSKSQELREQNEKDLAAVKKNPPALPVARAPKLAEAANADLGKVDWTKAGRLEGWRQATGLDTKRNITGWVVHDDAYLYVKLEERLDPAKLTGEGLWDGDNWEIFVARERGKLPYYQFAVNPAGKQAALVYETTAGKDGKEWGSGMKVLSDTKSSDRWTVFLAIPMAKLAPGGIKAGQKIYANFCRTAPALTDGLCPVLMLLAWSPNLEESFHNLDRLGELVLE